MRPWPVVYSGWARDPGRSASISIGSSLNPTLTDRRKMLKWSNHTNMIADKVERMGGCVWYIGKSEGADVVFLAGLVQLFFERQYPVRRDVVEFRSCRIEGWVLYKFSQRSHNWHPGLARRLTSSFRVAPTSICPMDYWLLAPKEGKGRCLDPSPSSLAKVPEAGQAPLAPPHVFFRNDRFTRRGAEN